tara:strand:+ start:831 stop:1775 length:945 start_codon:yes stop_codon:yes gene_type:complete
MINVVFMGTGDIGLPSLRWLIENDATNVVGVFTQPDRPFGRKLVMTPPEVKTVAQAAGIPVFQPEKLRDSSALTQLRELKPDLIVVMAYGQILKRAVIDLPTIACINLHASILPRHRGASPIQGAIRAGDRESGVTVMYVDVGLDTGDILLSETCELTVHETGGSLHDRLAEIAPVALSKAVPLLVEGSAPRTKQDETEVTYIGKLNRDHGKLDFTASATELERLIRAYHPWPGTYALLNHQKLKIFPQTEVVPALPEFQPGMIQEAEGDRLVITCGKGALALHQVQQEGRKRLDVKSFLAGHGDQLNPGVLLG